MLASLSFKLQAAHSVYKIVAVPRLSKKETAILLHLEREAMCEFTLQSESRVRESASSVSGLGLNLLNCFYAKFVGENLYFP
jgi:hypothetical protein